MAASASSTSMAAAVVLEAPLVVSVFASSVLLPHAEAALHLAGSREPDSFYLPELWLVLARARLTLGHADAAARAAADGVAWVRRVAQHHVPAEFQDSFLHRNPINRDLLELAGRLGA